MTRRNNKRNARRERNHDNAKEQAAHGAASMIMGAILAKALGETLEELGDGKLHSASPKSEDKPFNGVRQVSDNQINCGVTIPADGTAKEIPIPKGFEVFISEEGKPMIRKKIEGDGEPTNEEQPTTYEDIAKYLYKGSKRTFYWESANDMIETYDCEADFTHIGNCLTESQAKRLKAFNKLQNIAQYLNKGWTPNFDDESKKWFIMSDGNNNYEVYFNTHCMGSGVHFKTKELAEQAIRIMGEQSLADLFNEIW